MNHSISNKVTVLVFKDNYAARTFQIPLIWISRFGIFLGLFLGLATVSLFVAIKYYRIAGKTDLTHVQDLEQELNEAKTNLKILESKSSESPGVVTTGANTATAPVNSQPVEKTAPPAPTVPENTSANAQKSPSDLVIFSSFPPDFAKALTNPTSLSFNIQVPKAVWHGKNLRVTFALQYTKNDQGTQQGKILMLARGTDSLLIHPAGAFNPVQNEVLIDTNKGESFSVSRYREVKADFGPVKSKESIQEVEIFILNNTGQLMSYQRVSPTSVSAPKVIPRAKPAEETTTEEETTTSPAAPAKASTPEEKIDTTVTQPLQETPSP